MCLNSLFVFQNQWIIVPVIATGMETACLGLAIASLAFWAPTVAEVGIYTRFTLPLSPPVNVFLAEIILMPVPFSKYTSASAGMLR